MNYYIADLHLGHANAIRFDNRPFADADEMNEALIRNWNSVVTRQDTVYVLGDFIWAKESQWPSYFEKLNGGKVLIRGNHDPREFSQATKRYFQDIAPIKEITDNGKHVIMCHYPIPFHRADYDENCYMLHGHVHNTRENAFLLRWREEIRYACTERHHARGQFINVGCMMPWMGYQPRTLSEIIEQEEAATHALPSN
nr:MAG TPA: metallophosphatase domain protein [Caudoviricetes sp.]